MLALDVVLVAGRVLAKLKHFGITPPLSNKGAWEGLGGLFSAFPWLPLPRLPRLRSGGAGTALTGLVLGRDGATFVFWGLRGARPRPLFLGLGSTQEPMRTVWARTPMSVRHSTVSLAPPSCVGVHHSSISTLWLGSSTSNSSSHANPVSALGNLSQMIRCVWSLGLRTRRRRRQEVPSLTLSKHSLGGCVKWVSRSTGTSSAAAAAATAAACCRCFWPGLISK